MTGIPAKRAKGSRSEPRLDEQHVGARVIAIEHARHFGRLQVTRERDAAPLVGPRSAFAESFSVAGIGRPRQLEWLVEG
jgi:hypothetical protein